MKQTLHVLIVEDSENDAELVVRELQRGGFVPVPERVDTREAFTAALSARAWDAVIADYNLPQFSALEALRLLQESGRDLPFLVVSGVIGEEVAVKAMKCGAHDYILKNSLVRLVPAMERELGDARVRRERREAQAFVAVLSKLGQSLAAVSTPAEAARVISNIADELFGLDAFTLESYSTDDDLVRTILKVDTIAGEKQDLLYKEGGRAPSAVARRVIQHGAELILRDRADSMLAGGLPFGDTSRPSASLMFAPIRNVSRVIGVMSVQSYTAQAYSQRDLHALQTLADYCGGALERMRTRDELDTSREQLRALAAKLQSVREEERKFITREIHDELGQALTGFKMDLAWMRNRMQVEKWDQIRQSILEKIKAMGDLLDGTANLVRKICTELRPGVLDDLGLTAAIEWQAREYQKRTGIICSVKLDMDDLTVDPERSTALFRIFQEILTNVARHAQASRVDVTLKLSGSNLVLEVRDNGRGIKAEEIAGAKSLGLLGMRERAHILHGHLTIHGDADKGTVVIVKIPLPEFGSEPARAAG